MGYDVLYSDNARKNLKKIDRFQAQIIISWIEKNLIGCYDPRLHGKPLEYGIKGLWRYRVGNYRIIADIQDNLVRIEIFRAGHRREVYND